MSVQRRAIFFLALGAMVFLAMNGIVNAQDRLSRAISDLDRQNRATVESFVASFLRMKPPFLGRSANDLGWDCLAAAELTRLGVPFAKRRLEDAADALVSAGLSRPDGALGWTATSNPNQEADCGAGAWRSMTPGRCIPAGTAYSFQSGLAISCLAIAGELLGNQAFVALAERSFVHWDAFRTSDFLQCNGCLYYWFDDAGVDAGRYVRNLSMFMGLAAASLAAHDTQFNAVARAVILSDIWERTGGNKGYLGSLDPLWSNRVGESDRIENHTAIMALVTYIGSQMIDFRAGMQHAYDLWRDWATCDNLRCRTAGCHYWSGNPSLCTNTATFTYCLFRNREIWAHELCNEAIEHNKGIPPFALLAILRER